MDAPPSSSSRPPSYARRLLIPANAPPPPIPPRLRARFLHPRVVPPKPAAPQWLDGDEFALARSSSTSQTRMVPPRRSSGFPQPTGPPITLPEPPPPRRDAVDAKSPSAPRDPPPKHNGKDRNDTHTPSCPTSNEPPARYATART